MNIETANILLQYRKKSGLSQEELASKIGVSRQAVSKWERAEASPDTDNLILLAKVYGVTLDELLTGDPEEILNRNKQDLEDNKTGENTETDTEKETENNDTNEETKAKVSFRNGIHVDDGKDKVDISFRNGIHVDSSDGAKVHIDRNGINVVDESGKQKVYTDENGHIYGDKDYKKNGKKNPAMEFPIWLVSVVAFFLFGFLDILGGWVTSWLWFLVIPLYYTTVKAIQKKKVNIFCYPVFITWIYLVLGLYTNLWHPMWLLFLTIPLFYYIANIIDRKNHPQEDINIEQDGYSATVTTVTPQKESHILRNTIIIVGSVFCVLLLLVCFSLVFGKNGSYTKVYSIDVPVKNSVHTINVDNSSGELNFYRSKTNKSYVEYKCEYKGYFGSLNNDVSIDKIDIKQVDIDINPKNGFGFCKQITNVYISKNLLTDDKNKIKTLNIESGSGLVNMKHNLGFEDVSIDLSSGECNFSNLKCRHLTTSVSSGNVNLNNITGTNVKTDVSSGSVDGKNITANSLKTILGSGDTNLQGNFDKTDLEVSSGSVQLDCNDVPRYSDINISSGSVEYIIPDSMIRGFNLVYEKSSGSIDSDFEMDNSLDGDKGNATYKEGKNKFNVKMSSGSLDLKKAK
nr:helix-turn-helix domain-containing protein [uncultured Ruminococcus sp.]